jgi:ABC-type polysaccharide/polyol phosphate export permease
MDSNFRCFAFCFLWSYYRDFGGIFGSVLDGDPSVECNNILSVSNFYVSGCFYDLGMIEIQENNCIDFFGTQEGIQGG